VNNGDLRCDEAHKARLGGAPGADPQDKDHPFLQARQKPREGYAPIDSSFCF